MEREKNKVLFMYGKGSWNRSEPYFKPMYRECYSYFYNLAEKMGLDIYRASFTWYDQEKKEFTYAWRFKDGKWQRVESVKPDLVYDKAPYRPETFIVKKQVAQNFLMFNDPDFDFIASSKLFTSLIFPQYFKKYYKFSTQEELQRVCEKIKGELVVLKPSSGSGGKDICILNREEIAKFIPDQTMIAQEFIDSSKGIKGIVDSVHDLRLVFIGNELIYSYIRIPAQGSLLANLAQGGEMHLVEEKMLPESLKPIIEEVQDKFSVYPDKIYTIDLMFDEKQKPWIVELNTMPGMFFAKGQEEVREKMYGSLFKFFQEMLK